MYTGRRIDAPCVPVPIAKRINHLRLYYCQETRWLLCWPPEKTSATASWGLQWAQCLTTNVETSPLPDNVYYTGCHRWRVPGVPESFLYREHPPNAWRFLRETARTVLVYYGPVCQAHKAAVIIVCISDIVKFFLHGYSPQGCWIHIRDDVLVFVVCDSWNAPMFST